MVEMSKKQVKKMIFKSFLGLNKRFLCLNKCFFA